MNIYIAIDSDSLIYKACYRHQYDNNTRVDIEKAYVEFCYEIGKIRSAVFKIIKFEKGDKVIPLIVLSPKKTFRNDLSADYKAQRPAVSIHGIKQLKIMVMHRLKDWAMVVPNIEADDVCIYYAQHHNYLVAAIDKDVINACPTSCYNYNYRRWEQPHMPLEIEWWLAKQALMGDSTDGIKGAPNIGVERASAWVTKFVGEPLSWTEFANMFDSEEEAIVGMNLVRMDRLHEIDGKLVHVMWDPWINSNGYWDF